MALAFKHVKTYAKLAVMIAITVAILLVVVLNRNHKVDVWLFHTFPQTNVLWVMLVSGASAVGIGWILSRVRQVLRDLREIRKAKAMEAQLTEQRQLAEEARERESRIDEKIQQQIDRPGNSTNSQ